MLLTYCSRKKLARITSYNVCYTKLLRLEGLGFPVECDRRPDDRMDFPLVAAMEGHLEADVAGEQAVFAVGQVGELDFSSDFLLTGF